MRHELLSALSGLRDLSILAMVGLAVFAMTDSAGFPGDTVRNSPGIRDSRLIAHMRRCDDCRYEDKIRCEQALEIVERTRAAVAR